MNIKKLLSVLLALVCVISVLSACGGSGEEATTAAVTETTSAAAEETTLNEEESTAAAETEETTTAEDETEKVPETKEEILAAYTKIMNQAKKDAPGYKKAKYQELPDDANSRVVTSGSTLVNAGLKLAANYMTDEETAKKNAEVNSKGGDMASWPVVNTDYGCLLTDASALKDASYEELSDGNVKITIVLATEKNPEPTPSGSSKPVSNIGSVFCPLSKNEIDETLNGGVVSAVFKDISYSLTYHDCSSTVVYNPETMQVVSLNQVCYVTIKGSGTTMGMTLAVEKQELINYIDIYDVTY